MSEAYAVKFSAVASAVLVGSPAWLSWQLQSKGATDTQPSQNATCASPRFARLQPFRNQSQLAIVSTFQSGRGYTANTGTWITDTAIYALSSQAVKTTVKSGLASTYRKCAQPAADVSDHDFAVLIKVDVPTELEQFQLYLGKNSMAKL